VTGWSLEDPQGPWARIAENAVHMVASVSPHGFATDWLAWRNEQGATVDPVKGNVGSYDSISVYLWAGMTSPHDPQSAGQSEPLRARDHAVQPDRQCYALHRARHIHFSYADGSLRIEDTGPGIPTGALPHVFERFYRADPVLTSARGFGIGLSIVKQICDRYGWPVELDSGPNQGTRVSLRLLLTDPNAHELTPN
jgi:Histidine kinase-, DNA gyrase B-, and HSP90-like ATPase/Glycosyl hydrolases family 8